MQRKLRFGMIGGGNGGNIGNSHRRGAQMDSLAILSAGCFTRNPQRNKEDGLFWGVPEDRIYANYEEMAEKESQRADCIDFVSIVSPNMTHYPAAKCFLEHGINVVCEKPFTMRVEEAEELQALAAKKGLEVCITYTYAHYPIMRECRNLIASGAIGNIIDMVVEYPQDWMILGLANGADDYTKWIDDPALAGNSNATASTGTHMYYLIRSMTGLKMEKVLADFSYYPENANLETSSRFFFQLENGAHGMAWTSSVAIGHDCTINLKIYGDKGSIEWSHNDPTHLKVAYLNGPVQIFAANRNYLCEDSRNTSRIPAGHPEGFYEAFANIYRAFCTHLLDKLAGTCTDRNAYFYPHVEEGVNGVRFVNACVESNKRGNVWVGLEEV